MLHPERIREKMDEQKPSDQTDWVRDYLAGSSAMKS